MRKGWEGSLEFTLTWAGAVWLLWDVMVVVSSGMRLWSRAGKECPWWKRMGRVEQLMGGEYTFVPGLVISTLRHACLPA